MIEVTREDLNRVHARIDGFEKDLAQARERMLELVSAANQNIASLNTTLTLIGERLGNMNKTVEDLPDLPERPCPFLTAHLNRHEETRGLWIKPLVSSVVSSLVGAGVSLLVMIWSLRDKLKP